MIDLIKRFWRDDSGAVAFETAIMLPVLAWTVTASFVFFDAYRVYNSSVKATYAIADAISRDFGTLYGYEVNGMNGIFEHIVRDTSGARMRVSQIQFDGDTNEYQVDWSFATGGEARLFNSSMVDIEELLPIMAPSDRIVLVETFVPYQPAFNMGLDLITFENFTFTRPRYACCIDFDPEETAPAQLPVVENNA
ncbi:MAG: hypothetical protein AAF376_08205 [Pseudomonadota bacterium]